MLVPPEARDLELKQVHSFLVGQITQAKRANMTSRANFDPDDSSS
jgi:hypothetical protein